MTPLKHALDVRPDEQALREGWRAIEARLPGRRRRVPRLAWAAGALAAAAVAAVVVLRGGAAAGPLALADGGPLPGELVADTRLSDGSEIAIREGRLEVVDSDARTARWLLAHGTARFSVRPGGPRRWTIDAGAVQIEVIGTVFSVARTDDSVTVAVEHGVVLVRGERVPGLTRRLQAGEELRVPSATRTASAPAAPAPTVPAASTPARPAASVPARPPARPAAPPPVAAPGPRSPLVEAAPAVEEASRPESGQPMPSAADPHSTQALLTHADELRKRGDLAGAAAVLSALTDRPGDPVLGIAWFTRARIALELGHDADAAVDLRRAIAAGLPTALEARARARLAELSSGTTP